MPRHPRLFIPGATYHVYCRVARGEFVFDDNNEATEFVEVLREVRDLDGWTILAWCLMGNHYQFLAEERSELSLPDFVVRFESASGHRLDDLASRFRTERHICGRIEFSLLAISRYGFRACDIAAVLRKGRNSVTRWLNRGLCDERDDPVFSEQIDRLDAEISIK